MKPETGLPTIHHQSTPLDTCNCKLILSPNTTGIKTRMQFVWTIAGNPVKDVMRLQFSNSLWVPFDIFDIHGPSITNEYIVNQVLTWKTWPACTFFTGWFVPCPNVGFLKVECICKMIIQNWSANNFEIVFDHCLQWYNKFRCSTRHRDEWCSFPFVQRCVPEYIVGYYHSADIIIFIPLLLI